MTGAAAASTRTFAKARDKPARDPHGAAPERSELVLLLVDVINDFDFSEGNKLLRFALPAARRIAWRDASQQMKRILKADIRPSLGFRVR